MSLAEWSLAVGALLVTMVLAGSLLGRLPLSSAMVYLALGAVLGPWATNVLTPDPFQYAGVLEAVAELALLISLFAVGLQLGVPLRDRRWRVALRSAVRSVRRPDVWSCICAAATTKRWGWTSFSASAWSEWPTATPS